MPRSTPRRAALVLVAAALAVSACAAPSGDAALSTRTSSEPFGGVASSWEQVQEQARGQTVSLWMWGGDPKGNAYVDDVLAPAAADLGVTLRRVPIADTTDAITRILAERQAGRTDGEVDLVWVNGDNFATGKQAGAWRCGWADGLPNAAGLAEDDPLLGADFGTVVDGCEAPWHKAHFTLVYDSARVGDPPTTLAGVLEWARQNPGRFTYPAPPDFTGSVFVRQVLYSVSGGHPNVPAAFDQIAYDELTPALWSTLTRLAPSLWREGRTYPRDSVALDRLFADGQVDMTMTYGPATLTDLVAQGTFPATTRILTLEEGTVGNASFLAIPASSGHAAGAHGRRRPGAVARAAGGQGRPLGVGPVHRAGPAEPPRAGRSPVRCAARLAGRAALRGDLEERQPGAVGGLGAEDRRGVAALRAGRRLVRSW